VSFQLFCRNCKLTKQGSGTIKSWLSSLRSNYCQLFIAPAWGVSLFSGFLVFAGKANHQGWWRCLVALRLRQVCKASCARSIPSDILSLT
jgi:hypothetical protein